MAGRYVRRVWQHDPTVYAPPRFRRACSYDAFIPATLDSFEIDLPGAVGAVPSEAERAVIATGRTRPAVTTAIAEWHAAGFMVPRSSSSHNRIWEADGLLDLIVGLESGRF